MIPFERQLIERMQWQLTVERELSRQDVLRQIDNMKYYIKRMNSINLLDFPRQPKMENGINLYNFSHYV